MVKWFLRIGLGFLAIVAVTIGVTLVMFLLWRGDAVRALEADPDRRVAHTALGDIEYAVVGEGTPILALHGTPGNYAQSLSRRRAVGASSMSDAMMIAVSRPGYFGTPLSSGATFEAQADLFAALLDELGVDRAIVYAASGGGPAGLQFALRHPERTRALILYAPLLEGLPPSSAEDVEAMRDTGAARMFALEVGMWLVSGPLASSIVADFDASDPAQAETWAALVKTAIPWRAGVEGQHNDSVQFLDFDVDSWPLENIEAPTLIMHGTADTNAPFEASRAAAERIPNAELVAIEGGDHFVAITRAAEIAAHIERFIQSVTTSSP